MLPAEVGRAVYPPPRVEERSSLALRRLSPLLLLAVALMALAVFVGDSSPASAQDVSRKSLLYYFAAVEGDTKLSLEELGMTGGVTIEPEFSPTTYSYTVTVPYQEVEFRGKFITIWKGGYKNWGWVAVDGDLEEHERITNRARYGTPDWETKKRALLTNAEGVSRSRSFTLQQDVAQTVQIGVYRWRPGKVADPMPGSIFKTVYTLTVNYEPPAEDDTGLYDLTISDGWLDFDPFDTDATAFTVYVPSGTESVVITPTTTDPDATATVKGSDPANAVALTSGGNIIPIVVTAEDGETTQTYSVTVFRGSTSNHSALIAQMKEWRNRPEWVRYKTHTDRWDRALLALGETVEDTTLTKMTAAEAQAFADIKSEHHRWVAVADALRDVEAGTVRINAQNQRRANQEAKLGRLPQPSTGETDLQDPDTNNQAPAVAASIGDATIVSAGGTKQVSLSGVFSDADNDALIITAASSDDAVATVSVASDNSSLTVSAQTRGTADITVTAADGNGGTVDDSFSVTVKAAPVVASAIADVSGLAAGSSQDVSLSGVFSDADGDALTITAASDDEAIATVSAASDGSSLTLTGAAEGTATITATAEDSDGNRVSDDFEVSVTAPQPQEQSPYADLIAQVREWRNDPNGVNNKSHTDRWDRALLALGETVSDSTLTPMTAAEAQDMASRYMSSRWNPVAEALQEIESGGQQQQPQVTPNQAPTVSASIADATIVNESGTKQVSLSGVFSDADNDALTITAASSDDAVATVSVASNNSSLTLTAKSRGTATITVTASDGNGGTVDDTFSVTVKAAPVVASAIADLSLDVGGTRDITLSEVFSDGDGDALTFTATSTDLDVANALEFHGTLTIIGGSVGSATVTATAQDSDGNRVSSNFDVSVTKAAEPDPTPTPEPTPTPTPAPEPETQETETETSDVVARYDVNGDGNIDQAEYIQALDDYDDGNLNIWDLLKVRRARMSSG